MKKNENQFKILNLTRKNSSCYGYPTYNVVLESQSGDVLYAKTASDAACAYGISKYADNCFHLFTYHYTKNGNLIIDYIRQ